MKVEIWSDVMCPFCYIGKRRFERALAQFPQAEKVQIEWKSFQLDPESATDTSKNYAQVLAEKKNMPLPQVREMFANVAEMGRNEGLRLDFDKAVVANSLQAHRFTHLAKAHSKQNEAEELLFKAHFTDGKNIDDAEVLAQLGEEIGIGATAVRKMLASEAYISDVQRDQYEAYQIGVRGVPFFVFNDKYAISGAQESRVFLSALQQSFREWQQTNSAIETLAEGASCSTDGTC
jgi:predicted DsbA family dithiol-disulfide isomerase